MPYNKDSSLTSMKKLLFFLFTLGSFSAFSQSTVDVTFKLNMKGVGFSFTTPEVNGTWNNWCGNCNQMTDANGDSIWEAVIPVPNGIVEYKFSADNWGRQETLAVGTPCTIFTPPSFNNRKLVVVAPTTLKAVCWGSCDTCSTGPVGPSLQQISLPITWQDTANVNYATTDFGGTFSSLVADPVNPSKMALKIVKGNTAEVWAGTTLGTAAGFQTAMPFSATSNQMQAVVYSPAAGTIFRLKVEDKNDPTKSVETPAVCSQSNGWEVLTFDFANQASGTAAINYGYTYNKLSIFPNFGITGAAAGEQTYFVSEVAFGTVTATKGSIESASISVVPNPASGEVFVSSFSDFSGAAVFNVTDLAGRIVKSETAGLSGKYKKLDLSSISNGVYVLSVIDNGKTIQKRLIIQN